MTEPSPTATERIFRLAEFATPVAGVAISVAFLATGGRADNFLGRLALITLTVIFCLGGIAVFLLRHRYSNALDEGSTLRQQIEMAQQQSRSLRTRVEVLAAMREVGQIISDDVDAHRIQQKVLAVLDNLLSPDEVCIVVREHQTGRFLPAAMRKNGATTFTDIQIGEGGRDLLSRAIAERSIQQTIAPGRGVLVCPLLVDKEAAGAVLLVMPLRGTARETAGKMSEIQRILADIAPHIALAIKTPTLHDRAITDGLTGLYSHTYFENQLREHTKSAQRYRRPLSLIMADIDLFKGVNDVHGHLTGDIALRNVALEIKQNVRNCDSVFRYGGEEFAVILPETTGEMAQYLAERLRKRIEDVEIKAGEIVIRTSISLGVAELTDDPNQYESIVSRADAALLAAKKAGRNRTCIWRGTAPQPVRIVDSEPARIQQQDPQQDPG